MKAICLTLACWLALAGAAAADAKGPLRIVFLGDSLAAGYQLAESEAVPANLQRLLIGRGRDVEIINAGVSGDTATDGLARLDWSVPAEAGAVIVELGANDALRGLDPRLTRAALDRIVARLTERGKKVLIAGMLAPPNLGPEYAAAFNPIFAEIAAKHNAILYPFFLDGVAGESALLLADGMHPNARGTKLMAERILPAVETLIGRMAAEK